MRGPIAFCLPLLLVACGHAFAADPTVGVDPARFGWQGAYVGIAGGYTWLKDVDNSFSPPIRDKGQDWLVGAYAGYLAQFGNFVVGGEAEANRLGVTYDLFNFITVENSYVVKARAGYAFDRFLVTGHAGGAYITTNFMGLKDWGWEAGAGVDYAVTDHLTVGAQYSHYGFTKFDGTLLDAHTDMLSGRVGYKF